MSISEFYDEIYFDYQVKRNKNGKVDALHLRSPLIGKTQHPLVYTYYYMRCAADLMEDNTNEQRDLRDYRNGYPKTEDHSAKHKNKIQAQFFERPRARAIKTIPCFPDLPNAQDLAELPPYSWFLSLRIKLVEPFLSHGDDLFYLLDNPISRDGASGLPLIKPTTWKGHFLDAAYHWRPSTEQATAWNLDQKQQALLAWFDQQDLPKSKESKDRVQAIFEEHGGLSRCPLRAVEELYRIAAGDKQKHEQQWLQLREKAHQDTACQEQYQAHALTILHAMRGYMLAALDRLCGNDDALYDERKQFDRSLTALTTAADPAKHAPWQGRLSFFPSYFQEIAYDVIAPVERKGRTVKQPIYLEMIPAGSCSRFLLFYLASPDEDGPQALRDLALCCAIVDLMLRKTGFSAKKGTGYGQAEIIGGSCRINSQAAAAPMLENCWQQWPGRSKSSPYEFQLDQQTHTWDSFQDHIQANWGE